MSTILGLLCAGLFVAGLGSVAFVNSETVMLSFFGAGVLAFASAAVAATWPREARIVKATSGRAWVAGFDPSFLKNLPYYHETARATRGRSGLTPDGPRR